MQCEALLQKIEELVPQYIKIWEEVCNIESPTSCKEGVDKVGAYFAGLAEQKGWQVEICPQEKAGDVVIITMNPDVDARPVTLSGHIDTVHPIGLFGYPPVHLDEEYIYGPGVSDCKGGVVASVLAMDALAQCGFRNRPVYLMLQTDEETGSSTSGQDTIHTICRKAKESVAFLNAEPHPVGQAILTRKGILRFRFEVHGKAGHSSICYTAANAVTEAAHKILELEKMKDPGGLTCNCGVIQGGTVPNSVAEECVFFADIRFATQEQAEKARQIVQQVADHVYVEGCSCTLYQQSSRPAMEHAQRNFDLLDRINELYAENGLPTLKAGAGNGGSDAAYTTIYEIPCIDSIGISGSSEHSVRETAPQSSLAESAKRQAVVVWGL